MGRSADKQLKKSIKRIEKELQGLGLNAEVLRELLSGGPPEDGVEPHQHNSEINGFPDMRGSSGPSASSSPSGLKKSGSARSLGKTTTPLTPKKTKRVNRRQARARAEYELAGNSAG